MADYAPAIVSVRWIGPADTLAAERDSAVVCLLHDARSSSPALAALAAHTPADVPVIMLSTAGRDVAIEGAVPELELLGIEGAGATLTELVRRAVKVSGEADLVLLDQFCRVPAGWLPRLRAAACGDTSVASATPLSGDGMTAGVPGVPGVPGAEVDRILAAASTRAHPRLLIGGPHCVYVRRSALELIGGVAGNHDTLAALIADLCEQFVTAGMLNVLADDLYLDCAQAAGAQGGKPATVGDALGELDRSDERSALQRALQLSRSTLSGLSVTIDARSLSSTSGGTQRYTLELVLALAGETSATVRAVIAPDIGAESEAALRQADGVEVITYEQAVAGVPLTDVVHRPQQVFSEGDLNLLRLLGRRVLITHQDLIGYHNPTYHETIDAWKQYRRITRLALAAADRVVFFSEHSRRDAAAEDLIDTERADVVGVALGPERGGVVSPPPGAPIGEDFLLCLGPDYRHKNRRFAIALTGALRADYGWPGKLVLAGAHVPHGSSRSDEEQLLAATAALGEAVLDLGSVDEPGRAWLFRHARAVLVPSVLEGFGLVPLEAADAELPCLFAAVSSLVEVVDPALATLIPWDPSGSAGRVITLLGETPERREHVQRLRRSAQRWTWERLARQLIGAYEQALRMPYRAGAVRAWQELERERYLVEVDEARKQVARAHEDLLGHLDGRIALASDQGFLTAREQQGLLRVGSRPALARVALWPFGVLGALRPHASAQAPETAD